MKFPALLLAGVMVSCSSGAVKPTPTPQIVYVTPSPVPTLSNRSLIALQLFPADARAETLTLVRTMASDFRVAWIQATRQRSDISIVPRGAGIRPDAYVYVFSDALEHTGGNMILVDGFPVVNIFATNPGRATRFLLHELGHVLGCCGRTIEGPLGHVTVGCDNGRGPIMCLIVGDAPTFSDEELAGMGL